MDRRQKKTKEAIIRAFGNLLKKKKYDHITVQDIIDEADIGRSTFYAHFETKDALLNEVCDGIFDCVFPDGFLPPCGFQDSDGGLEGKLTHILYHLKESNTEIIDRLSSDGEKLFLDFFKNHMTKVFATYILSYPEGVPEDYLMNHLTGSFMETVKWWFSNDTDVSPETLAGYFISMIPAGLQLSDV